MDKYTSNDCKDTYNKKIYDCAVECNNLYRILVSHDPNLSHVLDNCIQTCTSIQYSNHEVKNTENKHNYRKQYFIRD